MNLKLLELSEIILNYQAIRVWDSYLSLFWATFDFEATSEVEMKLLFVTRSEASAHAPINEISNTFY